MYTIHTVFTTVQRLFQSRSKQGSKPQLPHLQLITSWICNYLFTVVHTTRNFIDMVCLQLEHLGYLG